ncbi:DUF4126 family protein [Streptomyces sp. NPDC006733]|uniref:DUF4126 family protein n=1 Tax=Streptomyces sp. NPDC006733 TaxID=3155460 RepID=UPI0033E0E3D6
MGRDAWYRAALLGVAGGGRSQSPLAAVALTIPAGEQHRPAAWLASERATGLAVLAAVAELGLDKWPSAPSRLSVAGLLPRVVLRGWAAAALAAHRTQSEHRRVWALSAGVAGVTAVAGAVAGARWRGAVHDRGLPGWVGAVLEDAVVVALSAAACRPGHPTVTEHRNDATAP